MSASRCQVLEELRDTWPVFFLRRFPNELGDLDDGKFCPQTNWMDGFVMIHV